MTTREEIQARAEAALEGPYSRVGNTLYIGDPPNHLWFAFLGAWETAEFFAHAKADVLTLATRVSELERLNRELEIIDSSYAELTDQMHRALEHFTESGELKGTGKWRLDEIAECIRNMKAIDIRRRMNTEASDASGTAKGS